MSFSDRSREGERGPRGSLVHVYVKRYRFSTVLWVG